MSGLRASSPPGVRRAGAESIHRRGETMTRFAGMWFVIAIFAVSADLLAQEQLPKKLDGA